MAVLKEAITVECSLLLLLTRHIRPRRRRVHAEKLRPSPRPNINLRILRQVRLQEIDLLPPVAVTQSDIAKGLLDFLLHGAPVL